MSRATGATRTIGQRHGRAHRVLALALRLLVALTVAQTAELVHNFTDVLEAVAGFQAAHDSCPDGDETRECPPGCPTCHCSHLPGALPAPSTTLTLADLAFSSELGASYESRAPAVPDLPTVYRPPRLASV